MTFKDKLKRVFLGIVLIVGASLTFTRKSHAMLPTSAPQLVETSGEREKWAPIKETYKAPVSSGKTAVASTSLKEDTNQEIRPIYVESGEPSFKEDTSEPIYVESGEQLIGAGTTDLPIVDTLAQQSIPYQRLPGSQPGSRRVSVSSRSQTSQASNVSARRVPNAAASRISTSRSTSRSTSISIPGSSVIRDKQTVLDAEWDGLSVSSATSYRFGQQGCLGRLVSCPGMRQPHFSVETATPQLDNWNRLHDLYVHQDYKQKPLEANFAVYLDPQYDYEKLKDIFGTGGTPSVFSNNCKERVQRLAKRLKEMEAQKLANLQAESSSTTRKGRSKSVDQAESSSRRRRSSSLKRSSSANLNVPIGTSFDPTMLLFEDTIEDGHYIKAFTFMRNYATNNVRAQDNQGHKAKLVVLGEGRDKITALVVTDISQHHLATGDPLSATHADLYLRKRRRDRKPGNYSCAGCISNHTGIARELDAQSESKLERTARIIK